MKRRFEAEKMNGNCYSHEYVKWLENYIEDLELPNEWSALNTEGLLTEIKNKYYTKCYLCINKVNYNIRAEEIKIELLENLNQIEQGTQCTFAYRLGKHVLKTEDKEIEFRASSVSVKIIDPNISFYKNGKYIDYSTKYLK